jgi:RNA polymerase sigma factor (sigma-70 family)
MHDEGRRSIVQLIPRIPPAGETDRQLLQRFATQRDGAAFEALVHRHGGMVWRVCRQVLGEAHAAEDAFQATFLVLVRKAGSVGRPELLANWLYGVARRVALRARKTRARRETHERPGAEALAAAAVEDAPRHDPEPVLHEELERLPAKYRSPMVLCYLEGRTNEEAAQQLQWPVGTLKVRLLRGREILRTRLVRRGLVLSAAVLTTSLAAEAAAAVPPALAVTTTRAALAFAAGSAAGTGALSAHAVALAEGLLRGMSWTRLMIAAVALLTAGLLGTGTAWVLFRTRTAAPQAERAETARLQGTWKFVALESEGVVLPENVIKASGFRNVVQGNTLSLIAPTGEVLSRATFRLDLVRTPRALDITFTEGPTRGATSLAIYELDGDTWKICIASPGKDRPSKFVTEAGSGRGLQTLKRAAADGG